VKNFTRFEAFTSAIMNIPILWCIRLCRLLYRYQYLKYYFENGDNIKYSKNLIPIYKPTSVRSL